MNRIIDEKTVRTVILAAVLAFLMVAAKRAMVFLIHVYQRYAPDSVRNACRFEPSCSEYMLLAIEKFGLIRGVIKGIDRLFRCRPGNGGFDYP